MKIRVNDFSMKAAIEKAEKVMASKTDATILESIKITANNGNVTLTANNLVSAIIINLYGHVEESGSILIDKSNFKLIKKLTGELDISSHLDTVTVKANRTITFKQYDPEEFLDISTDTNNEAFEITESEFKQSLKIKTFALKDDSRPALQSLAIQKNNIVGCDGTKLARIGLNIDNKADKDLIIPIDSINQLDKILDKKSGNSLYFAYQIKDKEITYLTINSSDFTYKTKLIKGDYFKVDNMIPTNFTTSITVDYKALIDSANFATDIIEKSKNPIVFNIEKEFKVTASAETKKMEETIEADITGNELIIGFDINVLLDSLKVIDVDNITINFTKAIAPVVVHNNNETYLIMPVNLGRTQTA